MLIRRKSSKKKKKQKKDTEPGYEEEKELDEDYYPDIKPDEKAVEIYWSIFERNND